jgi:hypothetical protein
MALRFSMIPVRSASRTARRGRPLTLSSRSEASCRRADRAPHVLPLRQREVHFYCSGSCPDSRELRPEMPSLHSHSDRALECCRQVAPVRPIDLRKGLSSPPLQVGVSGAEKLPVVTNDEGPSEVLSTEWATCRRGVWGGRQYAPHAFGYPYFSACTQRCHVGLHPSCGNGIERR